MSKLEELREKIYSKAFPGRKRVVRLPETSEREEPQRPEWEEAPEEYQARMKTKKTHKTVAVLAGVVLGLAVLFWAAYQLLQSGFLLYFLGRTEIELSITAPERVTAGERVIYSVLYKNKSRNAIAGGELFFEYPQGAEPLEEIGEKTPEGRFRVKVPVSRIAPDAEARIDFPMRIFGKENGEITVAAALTYTPENAASKFTVRKEFTTAIERVPIAYSFTGGTKVRSGDEYELSLEYASNADTDFKNIGLRLTLPDGFQYQESDRAPDEKNMKEITWSIGTIRPGTSGTLRVKGVVTGMTLEPKIFGYALGMYDPGTQEWIPYLDKTVVAEIIEQPLGALVLIEGTRELSVSLGDALNGVVKIKNNSAVTLRAITVEMIIEGPVDTRRLSALTGALVGSQTLRWNVSTDQSLSELLPGEERTLLFSAPLRAPESASQIQNAVVTFKTTVRAAEDPKADFSPIGNDTLIVPINALPSFTARALYSGSLIVNTGPIPPTVGKKTTFSIILEADSFGGDISDVRISGFLLPYVTWENVIVPPTERIAYQQSTGEIIWNPGTIRASEGTRRVLFQVSFIPTENQVGSTQKLLSAIKGKAVDAFTKKDIEVTLPDVTTDLRDDFGVPVNSGSVIQ